MISTTLGSKFLRNKVHSNGLHQRWCSWILLTTFTLSSILSLSGTNRILPKHLLKPLLKKITQFLPPAPRGPPPSQLLHPCSVLLCAFWFHDQEAITKWIQLMEYFSLTSLISDFSWITFTAKDITALTLVLWNEQQVLLQMASECLAP